MRRWLYIHGRNTIARSWHKHIRMCIVSNDIVWTYCHKDTGQNEKLAVSRQTVLQDRCHGLIRDQMSYDQACELNLLHHTFPGLPDWLMSVAKGKRSTWTAGRSCVQPATWALQHGLHCRLQLSDVEQFYSLADVSAG